MTGDSVNLTIAALAGFAFFFSPCMWPLYPAYISYIAGSSLKDETIVKRSALMFKAIGFVLGFSIVFILLGATATTLGMFLFMNQDVFRILAGLLIVFFGLQLSGVLKLSFLTKERRIKYIPEKPGFLSSVLFGMAFAFAWSPCSTAILGTILVYAGSSETVYQGILLLGVFSLGFSIPFLILTFFLHTLRSRIGLISPYLRYISLLSGGLLVIVGILLLTDKMADISLMVYNLGP